MSDLARALQLAVEVAREAGAMLRDEFHRPGGPRGSGDHADIDEPVERHIRQRLLAEFPWRYLGEETGTTGEDSGPYQWLVDPNDGTSDYLRGWRGSAVSIGLLRDRVPVLGVVYAYAHPDDEGDLIAWAEGCPLTRNGVEVTRDSPPPYVFVSVKADSNAPANTALAAPYRYITMPSVAYRLALAAAGEGVLGTCLTRPCSWDYGAAHALLRGAGGILVDEHGNEITYTADGRSSCWGCFGGVPAVALELARRDWRKVLEPGEKKSPPFCLAQPKPGHACRDVGKLVRAQGCLLGQLCGDSLGGLVEFRSPSAIRAAYPGGVRDLSDGGTWNNLAGQPTDDSEMALMLARSLVHRGEYDPASALDAYLHWWPRAWDRGGTIRAALGAAAGARNHDERMQLIAREANTNSQANGSLMRISPLGIFCAGQPQNAAAWTWQDSGLTHLNPVCRDSCGVFVAAIAHAIATGCTAAECHAAAVEEARRSNVAPSVLEALEAARTDRPKDYVTNMGWVLIALQNAFYQLLHASSLEDGIVDTIMQGGDTDTTGAICGALLGALHGRRAVPVRWQRAILSCRTLPGTPTAHPQPQEFWPVDALVLAEALLVAGERGAGDARN